FRPLFNCGTFGHAQEITAEKNSVYSPLQDQIPSAKTERWSRVAGNLEPIPGSIRHKTGYTLDRVPVHRRVQSYAHSYIHYGQFRHANQPTMHVFGLGEETRVPRENPKNMQTPRTWHRRESNPGPWRCEANRRTC
ncbi:hypothetical protein AMELA_G00055690, partial [Ameiurus melas]